MKTGKAVFKKEAKFTRSLIEEKLNIPVDFSRESLRRLDAVIKSGIVKKDLHKAFGEDGVAGIIFSFGCFLGEVLINEFKGRWVPASKPLESKVYIPINSRTGYNVDVFSIVAKRLRNESTDLHKEVEMIEKELIKASQALPRSTFRKRE